MADRADSVNASTLLVKSQRRKCTRLRSSFIRSKGAIIVLTWTLLVGTNSDIVGPLATQLKNAGFLAVSGVVAVVCYLLYPLFGLLGEKWMRYNVILTGSVLTSGSYLAVFVFSIVNYFKPGPDDAIIAIAAFLTFPFFIGQVLLGANLVQFGIDQLQFSSSHELSSFVPWYFFSLYVRTALVTVLLTILASDSVLLTIIVLFGSGLITNLVVYCLFCSFKRLLVLIPAQHNNPVYLIWSVTRYTWKNRQPLNRSAFTYGEPLPSGFDVAKERFGGPFTTEMVENVKSFWFMSTLLFSTFGFLCLDNTYELTVVYSSSLNVSTSSFFETVTLQYYNFVYVMTVVIAIILYQVVIVPFFSDYIPSMLKRILIGLLIELAQLGILAIISFFVSDDIADATGSTNCVNNNTVDYDDLSVPYAVLLIPQFLGGISAFLVYVTTGTFIIAQGPRNMQGLLIGLWLMLYGFADLQFLTLFPSFSGCHWYYYVGKAIAVSLSVVAYCITAYRYRYRQRNELSDINERAIITLYTERQLERRDLHESKE